MKKNIIYSLILVLSSFLFSCNDSFLERAPLDELSDDNFWESELQIKNAANACYWALIGKDLPINISEGLSDNAPWYTMTGWRQIGSGLYGSDFSLLDTRYKDAYKQMRRCNYFLKNYERATTVDPKLLKQYAAEVRFLRAFTYYYLTCFWGDVPFTTEPITIGDDALMAPRTSRADIVDFMLQELSEAAKDLPKYIEPGTTNFGRISGTAAKAMEARVALQNERWKEAKEACEAVMPGGEYAYHQLYSTGRPKQDYFDLFTFEGRASRKPSNKEAILSYVFNFDIASPTRHNLSRELQVPDQIVRFNPTKSLVDSYLCIDGLPIEKSPLYKGNGTYIPAYSAYDSVFVNRDPRLKQSIVYPGYNKWYGKVDGRGTANAANDASKTNVFKSPKFNNDGKGAVTYTGYYSLKYCEPSKVPVYNQDDNDIIFIRYGEVLLNYAEAMYNLNQLDQTVIDKTINLLRDRVGMKRMVISELEANGLDLKAEMQRERRVEFFMEGQRWYDLIRWKQGYELGVDKSESAINQEKGIIKGIRRDYAYDQSVFSATTKFDANGFLIFDDSRVFTSPKNYLFSLPYRQMELNPNLRPNNPGWDD
ncbi:RagB/SusD family nutrient uptake outer membrane protein [Dysgonomonas sp. BGC7]|uniref:RagB/SusD family nutrient uptake outer membrane protein n=1 Tax=Dysgonomonas sp. BGC7 TaxID=1658008 RepID=UPI0006824E94|nr:RagB/SusD family nutrient uptake outer membrane protein [Dysgonomonas sp. BGC7]MBD8387637.1 RagB/SusD family nutrient uptake outer membrane protein [Dysgonomonas sp. BGC7]